MSILNYTHKYKPEGEAGAGKTHKLDTLSLTISQVPGTENVPDNLILEAVLPLKVVRAFCNGPEKRGVSSSVSISFSVPFPHLQKAEAEEMDERLE